MNLAQPGSISSSVLITTKAWIQTNERRRHHYQSPDIIFYYLIFTSILAISSGSIIFEDTNITIATTTVSTSETSISTNLHSLLHSNHHHHQTQQHQHNNSVSIASSSSSTSATPEDDESSLPLVPLVPPLKAPPSSFDHAIHLDKNNPKGLRFEEEPSDSYIVRSKSATLRCRTLNALNAWFTCNSGDERRIQSNQKISNYVDPQTGIRLIEIDLEITRSDVEEHTNSGYTNPFQCWCTAYGGHHQIMSRKASVSFAYLKKHFHVEPKSVTVELDENKPVQLKCRPPFGIPTPVVFWMRNDVIILESDPHPSSLSLWKQTHKSNYLTDKFIQNKKHSPKKVINKTLSTSRKRDIEPEDEDEDYDDDDEDIEYDASKQPEKEIGSDEEEDEDGTLLLPHHFDLAAEHYPEGKNRNIPINYHMTDDHSLVIKHVSINDQANYTCGVYNIAGVRFTKPATLTVFVNGEWSNWGNWSPCQLTAGLTAQGVKCGIGTQKRVRHCSNPAPVNNGQFCPGESVQVAECTILCPPIDGFWSPWTQWSTCSHDCTQVRRRICNNPVPQYGGHDCFGADFLIKNCTDGLCRKNFDPTNFIQQPIGPSPQSNDQIYFIIIFILILIILTFVIYIILKFQLHRRRHVGKTFHHTWLNGDSDHLSHGSCPMDPEDPSTSTTMAPTLLLLQQQDNRFYNKPIKGNSINKSPHLVNHYPMEQIPKPSPKHLIDKYHMVSRLNQQGLDHILVQSGSGSSLQSPSSHPPKAPLPTIPRDDDSGSVVSNVNRYEEPQFRSPQPRSGVNQKKISPPAAGTNSSSGSANTATTTANELSNESEPDYAEPIINEQTIGLNESSPSTAPPVPTILPPMIYPVSTSSPRYSSEESSGGSSLTSTSSDGVGALCGRHEKFVKVNTELIRYGHYSSMPNLGIALYLPPGFLHNQLRSDAVTNVGESYIRYGIDTRARYPGLCSLSSVITLSMSKHHHQELHRPVILCFRHCLSFNQQMDPLWMKKLVIIWQQNDQQKSSKWIELVRYGEDNDSNYVHLDSSYVYLVTRVFGSFMFGFKHDFNVSESNGNDLALLSMGRSKETPMSKLINFSMTIEQFSSTEHLIKCFVYDNLPSALLMFRNDQLPNSSPTKLIKVMIGRLTPLMNAYNSSLKLSVPPQRSSVLCFELQTSCRLVKGSKRIEIPLEHLCSLGPNSLLHCSFMIVASENLDEDANDLIEDSDNFQSSDDDQPVSSSPTYQNNLQLLRRFKNLNYDIKVWQQKPEIRKRSHHHLNHHHTDFVTLNHKNLGQLRRLPGNNQHFYNEECCRLFSDSELNIRRTLIECLDRNESGWRQWASLVCPFDGYLTYFAQQPSPSIHLMELWECKAITELLVEAKKKCNNGFKHLDGPQRQQQMMSPIKIKELFLTKLLHQLQTIRRSDLVDLILGHPF